ncbi:MAG: flagellar biosynthesis protein FliQ [Lachnospiraceae bacterium]|nr:flagellar biosynthesis protein FliQ [Lachnospiraceae bacterium]
MSEGQVLDIMRDGFYNVILCAAPLLLISLVVGLVISIFQTVTSIQEQTLTFVPKILSIFIALLVFGSFIMNTLTTFVANTWSNFSQFIRPVST